MKKICSIICDPEKTEEILQQIEFELTNKTWIHLLSKNNKETFPFYKQLPQGPGFIINSGGSTGRAHKCLIPCSHLNKSALASKEWLNSLGLDSQQCQIYNCLPLNHISGLMPWWRSHCWNAQYISISPKVMRHPEELERISINSTYETNTPKITSLVPTQLSRLLKDPAGIRWLQSFSVVWVGGALLPITLASLARKSEIRLAPCYGTTETTAMVTALSPEQFLSGINSHGSCLKDVQLRLGKNQRLEIKTPRLAIGNVINEKVQSIIKVDGWWASADIAELVDVKDNKELTIIGRVDTAINSGGEIVYPELVQVNLLNAIQKAKFPVKELLLIQVDDSEWGQRMVALIQLCNTETINVSELLDNLKDFVKSWPSHEQPIRWLNCPQLTRNDVGKWELAKWESWVKHKLMQDY